MPPKRNQFSPTPGTGMRSPSGSPNSQRVLEQAAEAISPVLQRRHTGTQELSPLFTAAGARGVSPTRRTSALSPASDRVAVVAASSPSRDTPTKPSTKPIDIRDFSDKYISYEDNESYKEYLDEKWKNLEFFKEKEKFTKEFKFTLCGVDSVENIEVLKNLFYKTVEQRGAGIRSALVRRDRPGLERIFSDLKKGFSEAKDHNELTGFLEQFAKDDKDKKCVVDLMKKFVDRNNVQKAQLPFSFYQYAILCEADLMQKQLSFTSSKTHDSNTGNTNFAELFYSKNYESLRKGTEDAVNEAIKYPAYVCYTQLSNMAANTGSLKPAYYSPAARVFKSRFLETSIVDLNAPEPVILSSEQIIALEDVDNAIYRFKFLSDERRGGVARIRLGTGAGKTWLSDLIKRSYGDAKDYILVDHNSSLDEMQQVFNPLPDKDLVGVRYLIDEFHFWKNPDTGAEYSEKEKTAAIKKLQERGATVILFGASESLERIAVEVSRLTKKFDESDEDVKRYSKQIKEIAKKIKDVEDNLEIISDKADCKNKANYRSLHPYVGKDDLEKPTSWGGKKQTNVEPFRLILERVNNVIKSIKIKDIAEYKAAEPDSGRLEEIKKKLENINSSSEKSEEKKARRVELIKTCYKELETEEEKLSFILDINSGKIDTDTSSAGTKKEVREIAIKAHYKTLKTEEEKLQFLYFIIKETILPKVKKSHEQGDCAGAATLFNIIIPHIEELLNSQKEKLLLEKDILEVRKNHETKYHRELLQRLRSRVVQVENLRKRRDEKTSKTLRTAGFEGGEADETTFSNLVKLEQLEDGERVQYIMPHFDMNDVPESELPLVQKKTGADIIIVPYQESGKKLGCRVLYKGLDVVKIETKPYDEIEVFLKDRIEGSKVVSFFDRRNVIGGDYGSASMNIRRQIIHLSNSMDVVGKIDANRVMQWLGRNRMSSTKGLKPLTVVGPEGLDSEKLIGIMQQQAKEDDKKRREGYLNQKIDDIASARPKKSSAASSEEVSSKSRQDLAEEELHKSEQDRLGKITEINRERTHKTFNEEKKRIIAELELREEKVRILDREKKLDTDERFYKASLGSVDIDKVLDAARKAIEGEYVAIDYAAYEAAVAEAMEQERVERERSGMEGEDVRSLTVQKREAQSLERERLERERLERERLERERREKAESDARQRAAEEAEREAERLARERAEAEEAERLAAAARELDERTRLEQERAEREKAAEEERAAAEARQKAEEVERERQAQQEREKQEREAEERAEQERERLERERADAEAERQKQLEEQKARELRAMQAREREENEARQRAEKEERAEIEKAAEVEKKQQITTIWRRFIDSLLRLRTTQSITKSSEEEKKRKAILERFGTFASNLLVKQRQETRSAIKQERAETRRVQQEIKSMADEDARSRTATTFVGELAEKAREKAESDARQRVAEEAERERQAERERIERERIERERIERERVDAEAERQKQLEEQQAQELRKAMQAREREVAERAERARQAERERLEQERERQAQQERERLERQRAAEEARAKAIEERKLWLAERERNAVVISGSVITPPTDVIVYRRSVITRDPVTTRVPATSVECRESSISVEAVPLSSKERGRDRMNNFIN